MQFYDKKKLVNEIECIYKKIYDLDSSDIKLIHKALKRYSTKDLELFLYQLIDRI